MKDPIKIIHKFKNNNRKMQYKVYIFIGPLVPKEIMEILESIVNKDFYTTLNTITKKEYQILENFYGEFWYEKFFLSYHINHQRNIINTTSKKKILEDKYNKDWYNKHISDPPIKKIAYSFATSYSNLQQRHKHLQKQVKKKRMEIDFRIHDKIEKIDKIYKLTELKGGGEEHNELDDFYEPEEQKPASDLSKEEEEENEEEIQEITNEEIEEQLNELNLEDITKMYSITDIETNKTIIETSKMISQAINDKKWEKETDNLEKKYDDSQEDIGYDGKLEDIYFKYYITNQYIYKTDTIKMMRQKITVSIPISDKFGKGIRILPTTQYFWSEYKIDNTEDEVMLGQKWIRRNELLKIDIKPNENITIYEKLRNNLYYLKDNFGYKIKREDDETNVIRYYDNFITCNEIFMLDIYNELGLHYNPDTEEKRNVYDVYITIYFPLLSYEHFEQILQLLTGKNNKELIYIESQFGTIRNDTKLISEVENVVEKAKIDSEKYDKLFSQNNIIQSIIHVNINDPKNITGTTFENKLNLYRIFDNFIVDEKYPFIQYQTPDVLTTYKIFTRTEKVENQEMFTKWFENSPYGINFKIKIDDKKVNDKYIGINLYETGRIEYKITWKEDDEATVEDINKTYDYVRDLLKKINSENKKIKLILPPDHRFKYAFINSIQKFTIPEKFKINHNDLSNFSRFFFPYVSLVIDPKKRKSKKQEDIEESSKYGTYLRYKRINKYENKPKMYMRILYYLRNYELTDKELIDEVAKQFNITDDLAANELDYVKDKYQKILKRSTKLLKKLKSLPKSKPPGIGIDIQGRDKERYKIRITGARNKEQLDEIIEFVKVLIYLYVETYLYKKKEYKRLKDMLNGLTKIAKRRNKVIEVVDHETTIKTIKTKTALDKARLGFRPEKGQNGWPRSCQNSGLQKRQPDIISNENVEKLINKGYKLNKTTGFYEKQVEIKVKGKIQKTILKAVKLPHETHSYLYYTCDPDENREYTYVGFLTKGNNPNNMCMPCCYKKDQAQANNQKKKDYYLQCLGEKPKEEKEETIIATNIGDKLYILQDTNKIQEGRFIYLPKYLDIFFNKIWNHDYKIKNHYLLESKSGYFFKYTVKHDYYHFLEALANIYDTSINKLIEKIIKYLEADKDNRIFTYLNNGDIAASFKTRNKFIEYIKTSNYLEYDLIGELTAIPGVLSVKGINYYILLKQVTIVKKALEKEQVKEKYYLECLNSENNSQLNENRDIIILIKEDKYYFPIFRAQKDEKKDKKFSIQKYFSQVGDLEKIIIELKNYHHKSCNNNLINQIIANHSLIGKHIIEKLMLNKIDVVKQYIDDRYKCRYLEITNGLFLPVRPSGIMYKYSFTNIREIKSWLSLHDTIKLLDKVEKVLKSNYIPKTVFYDKKKGNDIHIISLLLNNELIIPIKDEIINEHNIKKLALSISWQPLEENIDQEIINYNNEIIFDERYKHVKEHNFKNEAYNLYKLELSLYLNNNEQIKNIIVEIVRNTKLNNYEKKNELRKILFQILDSKLAKEYKSLFNETDKKEHKYNILPPSKEKVIHMVKNLPELKGYQINNLRDYCETNTTKNKCETNLHCTWQDNICKLQIIETHAIEFVNRILEEMIQDGIKFKEIIQESNYYVSDIVDYTQYTNRNYQKIIKTSNFNIQKLMSELFGQDKVPIIGKKRILKNYNNEEEYPELIELGKQFIQVIVPNKDSIIRAYVNSYYWIKNPLYDIESRNLGYYNELQTNLTYLFKTNIIDFIQNNLYKGEPAIKKYLEKYFNNGSNFFESTLNKFRKTSYNTDGKVELFILSYLILHPIVVYDNYLNIKYIFMQGEIPINNETIKNYTSDKNINKTIFLKFDFNEANNIPQNIYSIYYL